MPHAITPSPHAITPGGVRPVIPFLWKNAALLLLGLAIAAGARVPGRDTAAEDHDQWGAAAQQVGLAEVCCAGRLRHRRQDAVPARGTDEGRPRSVQVRVRDSRRRQPVRIGAAAGLQEEVRGSLQAAARRGREVLRLARQPRCARAALLQAVQHGRQAVLHVQPAAGRPVLRAREHVSGARTDRLDRGRAEDVRAARGRFRSSIIRSTRRATAMAPTFACARSSSRCS